MKIKTTKEENEWLREELEEAERKLEETLTRFGIIIMFGIIVTFIIVIDIIIIKLEETLLTARSVLVLCQSPKCPPVI